MAGCTLAGTCCDGNVTDKNEGDSFSHRVGALHSAVPLFSVCLLRTYFTPQIYYGGAWVNMGTPASPTTPILTDTTTKSNYATRPCSKNITFTLTCNSGSGGETYQCRHKVNAGKYIYYCMFTVQVNESASGQVITTTFY
jgi:hypothetical protein